MVGRLDNKKTRQGDIKLVMTTSLDTIKSSKKSYLEHLRPASPPKTNPWRRKVAVACTDTATESKAQEIPKETEPVSTKQESEDGDSVATEPPEEAAANPATPSKSRSLLQSAAPRAGDSLWRRPFGADIVVWAEGGLFEVHRSIVVGQSDWFRDNLPPPNPNHEPVDVHLPFCHRAVAHTLRYMYTSRLGICRCDLRSWDLAQIPVLALLYVGASDLQVPAMADEIIALIRQKTKTLSGQMKNGFIIQGINGAEMEDAAFHLRNALEVAYSHDSPDEMLRFRKALASLLYALMPLLVGHPVLADLLSATIWKQYATEISMDLIDARQRLYGQSPEACTDNDDRNTEEKQQKRKLSMPLGDGLDCRTCATCEAIDMEGGVRALS